MQVMIDINTHLFQWFRNFLIKTSGAAVKSKFMPNQELAEELHKPLVRKSEKKKKKSMLIF